MARLLHPLSASALALCTPIAAFAQNTAAPASAQQERVPASAEAELQGERGIERAEVLAAPSGDAEPGIAKSAIAAAVSTNSSSILMTFSTADRHLNRGGEDFFALTVEAPLNDSGEDGAFLTEQGLANKLNAKLNYTIIRINLSEPNDRIQQIALDYQRECRARLSSIPAYAALTTEQERFDFAAKACHSPATLWDMSDGQLRAILSPADAQEMIAYRSVANAKSIFAINFNASIGYNKFTYLDPIGFGELKTEKVPFAASVSAGINPKGGPLFLAAGYEYRRDFEAADKRVLCPPAATTTTECKYAAFDAPEQNVDHKAFALARFQLPLSAAPEGGLPIAPLIEAKIAYDFEDEIWGAEVPIYFFLNDKKELRGGLRFSWEEKGRDPDKDSFGVSLFVVKSFDRLGL